MLKILIVTIAILLSNCGSNDSNNITPELSVKSIIVDSSSTQDDTKDSMNIDNELVGTWKINGALVFGSITFNNDGNATMNIIGAGGMESLNYSYSLTENCINLTLHGENGDSDESSQYILQGDSLIIFNTKNYVKDLEIDLNDVDAIDQLSYSLHNDTINAVELSYDDEYSSYEEDRVRGLFTSDNNLLEVFYHRSGNYPMSEGDSLFDGSWYYTDTLHADISNNRLQIWSNDIFTLFVKEKNQ